MGFPRVKGKKIKALLFVAMSSLLVFIGNNTVITPVDGKLHIVYLGAKQNEDPERLTDLHQEMLASVVGSKEAANESMVYSYKHGFSGFAAKLTDSQAKKISEFSEVVHVMPNTFYTLQTTRSWDYLGISSHSPTNLMHETNKGDGVIIGIIDSGIWPESKMLNDHRVGPIPTRWKGRCVSDSGGDFIATTACNRKLIGAKWFRAGFRVDHTVEFWEVLSPRDEVGHRTHTATTTASSSVPNASYRGLARGVVRGGAPQAHLAVYKVFMAGISVGDVSWPTSTQLPWRLAPVEGCCRASASLSGVVGQVSSGKTLRARLKEKDNVNFERCLCGALGVGLEAHNQG